MTKPCRNTIVDANNIKLLEAIKWTLERDPNDIDWNESFSDIQKQPNGLYKFVYNYQPNAVLWFQADCFVPLFGSSSQQLVLYFLKPPKSFKLSVIDQHHDSHTFAFHFANHPK